MDTTARTYDVIAMGRSSIDLYSNDSGVPFVDITSFAAYVGGCATNISVGTRRLGLRAALFAAETARQAGTAVMLDIDFRPDQWHDTRAFGVTLRSALRLVDIVIGTEDEINAAMLTDPSQVSLTHSQVSDARVSGDIDSAIQALLSLG